MYSVLFHKNLKTNQRKLKEVKPGQHKNIKRKQQMQLRTTALCVQYLEQRRKNKDERTGRMERGKGQVPPV